MWFLPYPKGDINVPIGLFWKNVPIFPFPKGRAFFKKNCFHEVKTLCTLTPTEEQSEHGITS